MLFNNNDTLYNIQKIQSKGNPDKYTVFHKFNKDLTTEIIKEWINKLRTFNTSRTYDTYKCTILRDLKLPYNKLLSMDKNEISDSSVDFFSVYSLISEREKYIIETRGNKEDIFLIREFLKSNKITYLVYSCKNNKFGIIINFKQHHKTIIQELCLMIKSSEEHLNRIIDNY